MKYRDHSRHRAARYVSLGILFLICAVIFAVRLIYFQIAVRNEYATAAVADGNVRSVIVPATRGNICDRNGKVLVSNSYTKNIRIEYGALPEKRADAYRSYLGVLDFLEETGTPRASDVSPLVGSYPDYEFSPQIYDENSQIAAKFKKVVELWFVGPKKAYQTIDEALENITARELGEYIAEKFDITDDGKPLYSLRDTDRLIALRYNLAADDFGVLSPYVLAKDVDDKTAAALLERRLAGITVPSEMTGRMYYYVKPQGGRYASHILGTVGSITAENRDFYLDKGYRLDAVVGRSGCEYAFEDYLHGEDGELAYVEDENGRIISTYWIKEPSPGKDVWLTIDIEVQIAAEDALIENINTEGGIGGAVVATEPETGEIIAIASAPDNEINRAISAYEPGSTFKVGMALAALHEGIIGNYSTVQTLGSYKGMKCSHYAGDGVSCCGNIGVVKALERSCNYFFALVGDELGNEKMKQYAALYGLGLPTGIEIGLNAETSEALGKPADDVAYMAGIGQLHLFTPLQITQYIAMISGGGVRYSAHLLKYVKVYDSGNIVYESFPTISADLADSGITAEELRIVRDGMYAVVNGEDASGYLTRAFSSASYSVAGKTGTAEKDVTVDGVTKRTYNALFSGYAPAEAPKIAVTCFIEQGQTGGMASGVVRRVMDAYSTHVEQLAPKPVNHPLG